MRRNPGTESRAPAAGVASLTNPADLSGLVAQVVPSVVAINVEISTTDYFSRPVTERGGGSGWIIDAGGLVVTNNHVVSQAHTITASLSDGRVFPARLVAADQVSDLAVLKLNAARLPAAKLGDSSKLKPGMMVIAIGNALGHGIGMTAGWVSRLGQSLETDGETMNDLIETSAAINPGNSGGPLVNMQGEVVGITNAKLVTPGVEMVGYAISTKTALPIIEQLMRGGQIVRPYIGISLQTVDTSIASVFGLAVDKGAIITRILTGGPASNAGLSAGDVIVNIDDAEVATSSDASQRIHSGKVGEPMTITFYRGNRRATVQVTPIRRPTS